MLGSKNKKKGKNKMIQNLTQEQKKEILKAGKDFFKKHNLQLSLKKVDDKNIEIVGKSKDVFIGICFENKFDVFDYAL